MCATWLNVTEIKSIILSWFWDSKTVNILNITAGIIFIYAHSIDTYKKEKTQQDVEIVGIIYSVKAQKHANQKHP
jgi:hypothetical protein